MADLTFGQQAVGLTFNPSGDQTVTDLKQHIADIIDLLNTLRNSTSDGEVKRLLSIAITESQTAQMWAVKAATWGKGQTDSAATNEVGTASNETPAVPTAPPVPHDPTAILNVPVNDVPPVQPAGDNTSAA